MYAITVKKINFKRPRVLLKHQDDPFHNGEVDVEMKI